MSLTNAAAAGLVGAGVVTAINETARRVMPATAPRMEILGMRALAKGFSAIDQEIPQRRDLIRMSLAGDILSNGIYYSLVGAAGPNKAVAAGAVLGLSAGVGAVLLPGPLGLGSEPSGRTIETKAMTVAWYLAAGLAAGFAYKMFAGTSDAMAE